MLDPSGSGALTFGGPRAASVARALRVRRRDEDPPARVLERSWRRRAEEVRAIFERLLHPVGVPAPWQETTP